MTKTPEHVDAETRAALRYGSPDPGKGGRAAHMKARSKKIAVTLPTVKALTKESAS